MINESTISKLNDMRLRSMANSLREQVDNPAMANLSFEERIGLIVDTEWARRKNRQLDKLIRKASLKFPYASIVKSISKNTLPKNQRHLTGQINASLFFTQVQTP